MTAGPPLSAGPAAPERAVSLGLALIFVSVPLSISGMQIGLGVALLGLFWDLRRGRPFPRTPLDLPVLLFLGLTLLSALLAEDPGRGVKQFLGSWTVGGFYLAAGYTGREAQLRRLLVLLFVPAALVAAYGIFQHFTGLDFIRPGRSLQSLEIGEGLVYLPRGAFNHYQTFSNVFYLLFCIAFSMALHLRPRGERRRWSLAALPIGLALLFSYTRGVWLATLFALVFVTLFRGRRAAAVTAVTTAAALFAAFLFLPGMATRARSIVEVEGNVERLMLWETTWNMVRDHPLLGVGVGNYQRVQDRYVRQQVHVSMTRSHSHNNLLQVAAERGIFGLLILLWIWYVIVFQGFRGLWKLREKGGFSFALLLGCLTGALGFFLDGMFQNNFGDTEVAILFWLMAGLILRGAGEGSAEEPAEVREAG